MDVVKIRRDLNEVGFVFVPFPTLVKDTMISYVKMFIKEVAKKRSINKTGNKETYEASSSIVLTMPDKDFIKNFSKPFRMYPDNISQMILDWAKLKIPKILGVNKIDSNFVSPSERKINQKLNLTTYDIFWRCVRRDKYDVGPAHADFQFWELAKDTDDEVPVPSHYFDRWKIWIPLLGCGKENILQMMPYSHKENVPMHVITTPFGRKPWLNDEWYEKNKFRFVIPDINADEDCILFHDRLIHRGPKNNTSDLRISSELTVLTM